MLAKVQQKRNKMNWSSICLFIILIVNFVVPSFGQVGKILHVDETKKDSSFFYFYSNLREIVKNRDIIALATQLTAQLNISEEGSAKLVSKKEFLTYHKKDKYKELWSILEDAFIVGGGKFITEGKGTKQKIVFYAPFIAPSLLKDKEFLFNEVGQYAVVIFDSVNVYEKRVINSKIITVLSHDIVENEIENNEINFRQPWFPIKLKDGRKGYVEGKFIRSIFNVECAFIMEGNNWKIKAIELICD